MFFSKNTATRSVYSKKTDNAETRRPIPGIGGGGRELGLYTHNFTTFTYRYRAVLDQSIERALPRCCVLFASWKLTSRVRTIKSKYTIFINSYFSIDGRFWWSRVFAIPRVIAINTDFGNCAEKNIGRKYIHRDYTVCSNVTATNDSE